MSDNDASDDIEDFFDLEEGEVEKTNQAPYELAREFGGDPDGYDDLPFREEAEGQSGVIPPSLYVPHDEELLKTLLKRMGKENLLVTSGQGTGKTTIRRAVQRSFKDDFLFITIDEENENLTKRYIYETVIKTAQREGYDYERTETVMVDGEEVERDKYNQIREGVPWAGKEAEQAVQEIAENVRESGRIPVLIVDQIETVPEDVHGALQSVSESKVNLFITGRPEGLRRLRESDSALYDRLMPYKDPIKRFDQDNISEYIDRVFFHLRNPDQKYPRSDRDPDPSLFTEDAIAAIEEITDGLPRHVALLCRYAYEEIENQYQQGADVEDLVIDAELVREVSEGESGGVADQASGAAQDGEQTDD